MDARPHLGRRGEDLAAEHLARLGLTVVERNFRCREGEVDIVATGAGVVVFCEVKTRRTNRWGEPCEAVDARKQERLRRLAARWLRERRPGAVDVRFDVVSIVARGPVPELVHIADAF